MMLRIRPPRKAKRKVSGRWKVEAGGDLRAIEISIARWPVESQVFSATRMPETVSGTVAFSFSGIRRTEVVPECSVVAFLNSST